MHTHTCNIIAVRYMIWYVSTCESIYILADRDVDKSEKHWF